MNPSNELITVSCDCDAILIQAGDPIKLIEGTVVWITKAWKWL